MYKYNTNILIAGCHVRDEWIKTNVTKLGLSMDDVYYDDRPNGGCALYTMLKAWESPVKENETHRLVLQDDVELCDGFRSIVNRAVNAHPDSVFSLITPWIFEKRKSLENPTSPYIKDGPAMYGQGIIIPIKYLDECVDYIYRTNGGNGIDDSTFLHYCIEYDREILTTIPSIIQHIGDDSLVTPGMDIRRSKYYISNPSDFNWDSTEVFTPDKSLDWVIPNYIKNTRR